MFNTAFTKDMKEKFENKYSQYLLTVILQAMPAVCSERRENGI